MSDVFSRVKAGPRQTKTIIFHIGLEKTGTTSLQRFCYEHRRALLERGVLYPTESLAFSYRSRNHASLVAAYLENVGYIDPHMTRSWRGRSEVAASLREEIARSPARLALISAEHLSSRLYDREIGLLARDFSDFDCFVAVTLRTHEARLRSAYSSTIRAGRTLTLADFVAELTAPGNAYLRCRETISRWEGAFGRAFVRLLPLASGDDIVRVFSRMLFGEETTLGAATTYADNVSYGASVLEALRRVNLRLPAPDGSGRGALRLALVDLARAGLLKSFARNAGAGSADRLRLGAAERTPLNALVETDRAWLKQNYDVDLPPLDGSAGEPDAARIDAEAQALLLRAPWIARSLLGLARKPPHP